MAGFFRPQYDKKRYQRGLALEYNSKTIINYYQGFIA
jgi:hypothetical protein